jgi:SPP1 family predicted phage head-tail adaptor
MRAGDKRNKITIQVQSGTTMQEGLEIPNWIIYRETMASIEPIRGRELFQAQTANSEISVRIRTRFISGVNPSMRVLYREQAYDIETVIDPSERHKELELMCKVVSQ